MLKATNYNGSAAGNMRRLCCLFVVRQFLARDLQMRTVAYTSFAVCGQ